MALSHGIEKSHAPNCRISFDNTDSLHGWTGITIVGYWNVSVISRQLKPKKRIMLPSGTGLWQPEFPD